MPKILGLVEIDRIVNAIVLQVGVDAALLSPRNCTVITPGRSAWGTGRKDPVLANPASPTTVPS